MLKKTIFLVSVFFCSEQCLAQVNGDRNNYWKAELGYSKNSRVANRGINNGYYGDANARGATLAGLGLGTFLGNGFRTDIMLNYRGDYKITNDFLIYNNTVQFDQKFRILSGLLSLYYDFPTNWKTANLYLKTGIGMSHIKFSKASYNVNGSGHYRDTANYNDTENNFTWLIGGGLAFKLSDIGYLDVNYQYIDFNKFDRTNANQTISNNAGTRSFLPTLAAKSRGHLKTNELSLGLRFKL